MQPTNLFETKTVRHQIDMVGLCLKEHTSHQCPINWKEILGINKLGNIILLCRQLSNNFQQTSILQELQEWQ